MHIIRSLPVLIVLAQPHSSSPNKTGGEQYAWQCQHLTCNYSFWQVLRHPEFQAMHGQSATKLRKSVQMEQCEELKHIDSPRDDGIQVRNSVRSGN